VTGYNCNPETLSRRFRREKTKKSEVEFNALILRDKA
jgi:hypothetical protein